MGKAKGSLIPIRGSVEDWGPGRFQRNLEHKDAYAQKMREQVEEGPPNFEKLLAAGVTPAKAGSQKKKAPGTKRASAAKKKVAKKAPASKAKKKKKKKKAKGSR